mgnify:CR=1 FL=1
MSRGESMDLTEIKHEIEKMNNKLENYRRSL